MAIPVNFCLLFVTQLKKTSNSNNELGTKKVKETQPVISAAFVSSSKYKRDSEEQIKEEVTAKWIGHTGLPITTVEDEDFVLMMEAADRKLTLPKKTKISSLID